MSDFLDNNDFRKIRQRVADEVVKLPGDERLLVAGLIFAESFQHDPFYAGFHVLERDEFIQSLIQAAAELWVFVSATQLGELNRQRRTSCSEN